MDWGLLLELLAVVGGVGAFFWKIIDKRFDQMDEKFDKRFDKIETILNQHGERISKIEGFILGKDYFKITGTEK